MFHICGHSFGFIIIAIYQTGGMFHICGRSAGFVIRRLRVSAFVM